MQFGRVNLQLAFSCKHDEEGLNRNQRFHLTTVVFPESEGPKRKMLEGMFPCLRMEISLLNSACLWIKRDSVAIRKGRPDLSENMGWLMPA